MRKILIFDSSVDGHRLEYIHHLYILAIANPEHEFYFLLPDDFDNVKTKLQWKECPHIKILYLTDRQKKNCNHHNLLKAAWYKSWAVRRTVKKYNIQYVWLISLMLLMPFLAFLLPKGVKVSGVLYRLYFYEGTTIRGLRLLAEKIRYKLMVASRNVDRILVLNDQWATEQLNTHYRTDKFVYIPDPIPQTDKSSVACIREELGAKSCDKVLLHFGALNRRKGTLEILEAIRMMKQEMLTDKIFVFAGKVNEDMKEEFYHLISEAKAKCRIHVFDEFCPYSFLNNLCYSCDCILIPYKNPNQSSGVIGYAARFRKPVIGPSQGLLGRLIKEYDLGETTADVNAGSLATLLGNMGSVNHCFGGYVESHSVEEFNRRFLKGIFYSNK